MPDRSLTLPQVNEFLNGSSLEIVREIAPDDHMYAYNPDTYFLAGHQALRCIRLALLAARRDTAESILDFACGKGRVLRTLKAAFPEAALTASDIWEEGVEFCSRVFGATGIVSKADPAEIKLDGS